jgi:hypothetical protein
MNIFAELPNDISKDIYAIALKQKHDEALEILSMNIDAIISGNIMTHGDSRLIKIYERTHEDQLFRDFIINFNNKLFHLSLSVFKESEDSHLAFLWAKPSENDNKKSPEFRQLIEIIVEKMINIGNWAMENLEEELSADDSIKYHFGDKNNRSTFKAAIQIYANNFDAQFGHWENKETFRASEDIIDKYNHMLSDAFLGEDILSDIDEML